MRHVTITILLLIMYPVSFAFGMVGLLPLTTFPIWLVPVVTLAFVAVLIVWSIVKITVAYRTRCCSRAAERFVLEGRDVLLTTPTIQPIFVSKRVGIGYTMNFANKMSWLVMAGNLGHGAASGAAAQAECEGPTQAGAAIDRSLKIGFLRASLRATATASFERAHLQVCHAIYQTSSRL